MKIYQIIFTHFIRQPLFDKGFDITGLSKGADEADIEEIRDKFKPSRFNGAMLSSYSFFKLASGRYCVTAVKPMGDNTEDYCCHSLILDEGYWPFYPVQLLGSSVFESGLEWDSGDRLELPVLDDLQPGNFISYGRVSEFIKPRLAQGFNDMLYGAVKFSKENRAIAILDSEDNSYLWIAAIQMAFTVEMAHSITFSTAEACFSDASIMVLGISPQSSLSFQDNSRQYFFDYNAGIKRSFDSKLNFNKIVNTGYLVSRATLEPFHRFVKQFNKASLDESIEGCYNLFVLCYFHESSMDSLAVDSAFQFALANASEDYLEDIFHMLEPCMHSITSTISNTAAGTVAQFLIKTALNSKKHILSDRVCFYFYVTIDHLIFDFLSPDIERVLNLYKSIYDYNSGRSRAFLKYSISTERINYLVTKLSTGCSPERAGLYMGIILANSVELSYSWSQLLLIEKMNVLIDICINYLTESVAEIEFILNIAARNEEYFSRIVVLLYHRIKSGVVMKRFVEAFTNVLDTKEEKQAALIRRQISSMECGRLLFEEFEARLSLALNPVEFFDYYRVLVFDSIPDFNKGYISPAIRTYIQKLPFASLYNETLKILRELIYNTIVLDNDAASCVVKGFEDALPLSRPSEEVINIIPDVKKIKKARNIITSPDITGLIDFALWLEKYDSSQSLDDIIKESINIEMLDEKRNNLYINWCLPALISFSRSAEDHKKIVHVLYRDDMNVEFFNWYVDSIEDILKRDIIKGTAILLQFAIYFFFYLEPRCRALEDENLPGLVRNLITGVLSKQQKVLIKRFDYDIKKEFEDRKLSLPLQWGVIYSELTDKKNVSFKDRISSIFKKN